MKRCIATLSYLGTATDAHFNNSEKHLVILLALIGVKLRSILAWPICLTMGENIIVLVVKVSPSKKYQLIFSYSVSECSSLVVSYASTSDRVGSYEPIVAYAVGPLSNAEVMSIFSATPSID
jgi:hypothetical protein